MYHNNELATQQQRKHHKTVSDYWKQINKKKGGIKYIYAVAIGRRVRVQRLLHAYYE